MVNSRREFFAHTLVSGGVMLLPRLGFSGTTALRSVPTDNPAAEPAISWTDDLQWDNVFNISDVPGGGEHWDERLIKAQQRLGAEGGVIYFPEGVYQFESDIKIADRVILRGATPSDTAKATEASYEPSTRFEFPRYKPSFSGTGTPIDTAFKGIRLAEPATASRCGIVNIAINFGHVHFAEVDGRCGSHRIVYGCVLTNCAVADPAVPSKKVTQHPWQRFTARHHAAIDVRCERNALVANNRLPKSGEQNFTMKDFILQPNRGSSDRYDVVFDYDNRPGIYVNHHCVGGAGGSGNDGTPQTHPWGFRKGTVIRDNYVFHTGRIGIGFSGDGTIVADNVTRLERDVWRPTATGQKATSGSSTNDNRAIEMRGWRWTVDGNDCVVHRNWCSDKSYYINDGEGLMHEDHCNSDIRDCRLTNNKVNSYLSIYKCGPINGLTIKGNDVSVGGDIADIYVVASRNSGDQPCKNVTIANNVTRSNGIRIQGSPASNNLIRDNQHQGERGTIRNLALAKLLDNANYDTTSEE